MTLEQLINQLAARNLRWQLDGGNGPNGIPVVTALVYVPDSSPPIMAMRTRSGLPLWAIKDSLEAALTDVVGKLEVANHGE